MLVADAGKLSVLDRLLSRLKAEDHRVLIYSQMTRMIDILEVSSLLSLCNGCFVRCFIFYSFLNSVVNDFLRRLLCRVVFWQEFLWHRKHTYVRLDGSSKISERRDMVADFQTRSDIFVFLLSTRAGGLGINLTAADTVRLVVR